MMSWIDDHLYCLKDSREIILEEEDNDVGVRGSSTNLYVIESGITTANSEVTVVESCINDVHVVETGITLIEEVINEFVAESSTNENVETIVRNENPDGLHSKLKHHNSLYK